LRREGFSLLELVVVLVIIGVALGIAAMGYRTYQENTSTRRAAEVFVMDLTTARSSAIRERRSVAITFEGTSLRYRVETDEGRVVQVRDFSPAGEIRLGGIVLDLPGEAVVFDARGFASLEGGSGSLGVARFRAGASGHEVRFNALGRARIEPF
jgi:type II secretion system protein H